MTDFAKTTYQQLMTLVNEDEAFFFKDYEMEGKTYRVFDYQLASWTSFQKPSAVNCRGTAFEISNSENPLLVSLPPAKFFNYEEGGVNHLKAKLGDKMVKMDGSLISTYTHGDQVLLKSKGSIYSQQAVDSLRILNLPENKDFKAQLETLVKEGYTVSLEYTAPENRVVVPYQEEKLTVLSARRHSDGQNLFATKLGELLKAKGMNAIHSHLVENEKLHDKKYDHKEFIEAIRQEQSGEGYVIEFILDDNTSYLAKVKNMRYIALHHAKDAINTASATKRIFEAVVEQGSDDLRTLFTDSPYVLNKIQEMEDHVQPIFNHMVKTVRDFHAENKSLLKNEYAKKANAEHPKLMGLMINAYLNRPVDYKEFAKKNREGLFGVKDEDKVHNEESIKRVTRKM